jgi:hypothetical protein
MLSKGAWIGITAGACVFIVAVVFAVVLVRRSAKRSSRVEAPKMVTKPDDGCSYQVKKSQHDNLRDTHKSTLLRRGAGQYLDTLREARNPESKNYLMDSADLENQAIDDIERLANTRDASSYMGLEYTNCLDEKGKAEAIKHGKKRALEDVRNTFKSYNAYQKQRYREMGPWS